MITPERMREEGKAFRDALNTLPSRDALLAQLIAVKWETCAEICERLDRENPKAEGTRE